jgi:hypothetical protein
MNLRNSTGLNDVITQMSQLVGALHRENLSTVPTDKIDTNVFVEALREYLDKTAGEK